MADAQIPPIEVEIWIRVGLQHNMSLIGTVEYPYPAPLDEWDLLRNFAEQILAAQES